MKFSSTTQFLLEVNIILSAPILMAVINLSKDFRILTYSVIAVAIILYIFTDQFFHFSKRFNDVVKYSLGIGILNVIFLGLLSITGIFSSPFFFIIYILLMVTALGTSERITVLETLAITTYLIITEIQLNQNLNALALIQNSIPLANLFSIFFFSPLAIAISSYFRHLRKKEETLNELRLILAEEESEDEILLDKVGEGIFVLDISRKIVKISRTAEGLLNISARYALGDTFDNVVKFLDPLTGLPLTSESPFYKNLFSIKPKELQFDVQYKNEYGSTSILSLEQRPLFGVDEELDGFLIFMNERQKGMVADLVKKFNEFLFLRMSSIVSFITFARSRPNESKKTDTYLKLFIDTLNDANLYRRIEEKEYSLNTSKFSLRKIVESEVKSLGKGILLESEKNLQESDMLMIESDQRLVGIAVTHLLRGSILADLTGKITVSPSKDPTTGKAQLRITVPKPKVTQDNYPFLIRPFYQGNVEMLNTIGGSGLELPIAASLFHYLSIEFTLELSQDSVSFVANFKQ